MRNRGFSGSEAPVRLAKRIALVAMIFFGAYLLFGDKPWSGDFFSRIEQGQKPRLGQAIDVGLYAAAVINLFVSALLFFTARWWARSIPAFEKTRTTPRAPRWLWAGLIAAVIVAGFLRWNLAHGSLWWDEIWPLRNAFVGKFVPDKDDPAQFEFKRAGWDRTFFNYSKPTNHVTYSAAARVCLAVSRLFTGAAPHEFSHFAIHLPALIAGLASIFLVGVLVNEWGHPRAAVAAAFFFAINSWHIRHSAEARAYTFVLLFALLALWWLTRALRTGHWRYWLLFGFAQFLLVWSFPYAIYFSVALAVCTLAAILNTHGWNSTAAQLAARFAIASVASAMLVLILIAPHVPQVFFWSEKNWMRVGTDFKHVLPQTWSLAAVGIEPQTSAPETFASIATRAREQWWVKPFVKHLQPLLFLIGFAWLLWRTTRARWLALALVIGTALAISVMAIQHTMFIPRFVIYLMIATAAFMTIALDAVAIALSRRDAAQNVISVLLLSVFVGALFFINLPQIRIALRNPIFPTQAVAEFLTREAQSRPGGILTAGYGIGGDSPALYAPWLGEVQDAEELAALARRSREEQKPLYVFYGFSPSNRDEVPSGFALMDNPEYFQQVAVFDGIDANARHWILRYTGAPIADEDVMPQQRSPSDEE